MANQIRKEYIKDGDEIVFVGPALAGLDIGSTGSRWQKGWFTDLEVTNPINGSITGNAGTVTNGVYTTGAGTVFLAPNGSAAALTSFPTLNQNTTGSAATLTTTRTIWGQNFNGSANVTGTLALGTVDITMTGSIASTGSRVTKVWTAALESTAMPTVGGTAILTSLTAPQFTTIELGHATQNTLSASSGVLSIEGVVIPSVSSTNTLTNKRITPRTASSTTDANLTPDLSTANIYYRTTQTATLAINAPTGTPLIGETIMLYISAAGAQTINWNATYIPYGAALPTVTVAGKTLMATCQYNGTNWQTLTAVQV